MVAEAMTVARRSATSRALPAAASSARAARRLVRSVLVSQQADPDVVRDFEIVVSELVANAVEHGSGDTIVVGIDVTDGRFWEVSLGSATTRRRPLGTWRRWSVAGPGARSGRGLGIVRRLMDEVRVDVEPPVVGDPGSGEPVWLVVRCRRRR
ncbi:MAG: hypothetical protein F2534_20425 [Actinobacteria bacterium]|jgi:anti-sigma regulatory factor (Ser/Thr protein kinase)|uniref:Unannotated protein n=1 Tax=freshwater metagenome TaxID=449393 RepID=A0A6J6GDP8_9ZZZZ|nr:hypothetical protein [Actinomycetota bacterium]